MVFFFLHTDGTAVIENKNVLISQNEEFDSTVRQLSRDRVSVLKKDTCDFRFVRTLGKGRSCHLEQKGCLKRDLIVTQ